MKRVQVLMSTYNGERYLKEQIDSIMQQDCEEKGLAQVFLLVRDDGSQDGTKKILEKAEIKYAGRMMWYRGENKGVIESFFELVQHASKEMDYYAFSDQDDFWCEDKLRCGIEALEKTDEKKVALYCCRTKLVDENLKEIPSTIKRPPMRPGFCNALIENICNGCTIVMNRRLLQMAQKEFPSFTVMHDWWFYLLASCYGTVIFDETPHILYRQHQGNVVGTNAGRFKELVERIKRFGGNRRNISRQTAEFLRIFGEEPGYEMDSKVQENLSMARLLVQGRDNAAIRKAMVKEKKLYRQRPNDNRIFEIILRLGIY